MTGTLHGENPVTVIEDREDRETGRVSSQTLTGFDGRHHQEKKTNTAI